MTNVARNRAIKKLNNYIWTLQHRCDTINKVNENLIMQYCRFTVLAEEVSQELTVNLDKMDAANIEAHLRRYEQFNKTALGIYKALKFDKIKDEEADNGNPFTRMLTESQKDGDF